MNITGVIMFVTSFCAAVPKCPQLNLKVGAMLFLAGALLSWFHCELFALYVFEETTKNLHLYDCKHKSQLQYFFLCM